MATEIFTFPPDENFDDQWQSALAHVQFLEIRGPSNALEVFSCCIEDYRERLLSHGPTYAEEVSKIDDLAALAMRATISFSPVER